MSILSRFSLLCGICFLAAPCLAQNDPFDAPAGLFDAQPGAFDAQPGAFGAQPADGNTEETEPASPLVKQWLEHSRRGNLALADSISALTRLGRWSDVNGLLSRVAGINATPQQLAEMSQRIGASLFVRIKQHPEIGAPAISGIDKMVDAAASLAESPDRLRQAIKALESNQSDQQLAGTRALLSGGNPAIVELVAAAVTETRPATRDQILRTLLQLGPGGTEALRQLALYGTPEVRANAIESLARISKSSFVVEFVTAALAADAGEQERTAAQRSLIALDGAVPNIESGREILLIDFQRNQDAASLVDNDDHSTILWSVNPERNGVEFQPTARMLAAYRDVADSASRLRRVGGLSPEVGSMVLSAEIGYRVMVDPDWGDPEQTELALQAFPTLTDPIVFSKALRHSIRTEDHAASIGLIRLLNPEAISVPNIELLVRGTGSVPTPLIDAASSPEPRVRFEAALKVAQLAGKEPYAGSSYVMHTLSEMSSLNDKPKAILIETRPDVIISIESILGDLGFKVEVAHTVSTLQKCIRQGGDLRMVVAKTQLPDLPPIELVDLVRRLDRGRDVPIIFYGPDSPILGAFRWRAPTIWIDQPASTAGLEDLRNQVLRQRRLPQLTYIDRQMYRDAATAVLADLL
ncbi:MAG: hypothetical protein ACR2NZ_11265 [Rubripirellula sp.]